ncbi:MAG: hypothetical protein EOO51_14455 [Flavobacterium sp.]|nr:MAG: hypothetical protein EOO51_14455 [Flavobacterium sp.]
MNATITTLALNLLISERVSQRSFFASKINDLLDGIADRSEKEKQIKRDFRAVTDRCVDDPSCNLRDLFYHYAQYYGTKLAPQESLSSAA